MTSHLKLDLVNNTPELVGSRAGQLNFQVLSVAKVIPTRDSSQDNFKVDSTREATADNNTRVDMAVNIQAVNIQAANIRVHSVGVISQLTISQTAF